MLNILDSDELIVLNKDGKKVKKEFSKFYHIVIYFYKNDLI